MAVQTISVRHKSGSKGDLYVPLSGASKDKRLKVRDMARLLWALAAGTFSLGSRPTVQMGVTPASGTVTLATASGTITATINGVAVTAAYTTSDANTAALLAAAINASSNPLVKNIVRATSAGAVVTIESETAGPTGNAITLAASGTGATASGTRLTGGTGYSHAF